MPCAVAVALLGGSVLFSCSEDDETGVDESDFSASQFETLASRRMTRSAEGHHEWYGPIAPQDSIIIYENASKDFPNHSAACFFVVHASCNGGMGFQVHGKASYSIISASYGFSVVKFSYSEYFNGLSAIIEYDMLYSILRDDNSGKNVQVRDTSSISATVYVTPNYHLEPISTH